MTVETGTPKPAAMRNTAIDFVRALAILLVVAGHLERGLVSAKLLDGNGLVAVLDNLVYLYHVPIFFFLSGYLYKMEGRSDGTLWSGVLRYTVYPYLLWSVVYMLMRSNGGGFVNKTAGGFDPLNLIFHPISPFWFLQTLALMQVIAILTRGRTSRAVIVGGGLVALLVRFLVPGLPEPITNLFEFFVFYAIGLYCQGLAVPAVPRVALWLVFPVSAALVLVTGLGYTSIPGRIISLLLVAVTYMLIAGARRSTRDDLSTRTTTAVGSLTMPIFCMHVIFLVLVRAILVKLGITALAPHLLIGILAGTVGPMIAAIVLERINLSFLLGFKKRYR